MTDDILGSGGWHGDVVAHDLRLDGLITRTSTLDQVNEGYDDLVAGRHLRGLISHEH